MNVCNMSQITKYASRILLLLSVMKSRGSLQVANGCFCIVICSILKKNTDSVQNGEGDMGERVEKGTGRR